MTREVGQLYKGPMVRAIIKGTKTNTRRGLKPPKGYRWADEDTGLMINAAGHELRVGDLVGDRRHAQPGDTIWVRETYAHHVHAMSAARDEDGPFVYAADGEQAMRMRLDDCWTPSLLMPRYACRLLLTCTGHRIERLLDITEADARAEGIEAYTGPLGWVRYLDAMTGQPDHVSARDAYLALWEAINGAGSAARNPWVRSIYFTIKESRRHG